MPVFLGCKHRMTELVNTCRIIYFELNKEIIFVYTLSRQALFNIPCFS